MFTNIHKINAKVVVQGCTMLVAVLLSGGCAIVGTPPVFTDQPANSVAVKMPSPPEALSAAHLKKTLKPPQSSETLAEMGKVSAQNEANIIYYPGFRMLEEKEIVCSKPKISVELMPQSDATNTLKKTIEEGKCKIAMLDFKNEAAAEGASGRLAADFWYRALVRLAKERKIVLQTFDRKEIWDVIKGESEMKESLVDESEQALLNNLKKINYSGLILSGAVTTYLIENRQFEFPYVIEDTNAFVFCQVVAKWRNDYEAYDKKYDSEYLPAYNTYRDAYMLAKAEQDNHYLEYNTAYTNYHARYRAYEKDYERYRRGVSRRTFLYNFLSTGLFTFITKSRFPFKSRPAMPISLVRREPKPDVEPLCNASPKYEWPSELPTDTSYKVLKKNLEDFYRQKNWYPRPQARLATVCNIGITFRLVNGQTSRIIGIGNGDVRDISSQKGMSEVCDEAARELLDALLKEPSGE